MLGKADDMYRCHGVSFTVRTVGAIEQSCQGGAAAVQKPSVKHTVLRGIDAP